MMTDTRQHYLEDEDDPPIDTETKKEESEDQVMEDGESWNDEAWFGAVRWMSPL